jgi:hypothetical protein
MELGEKYTYNLYLYVKEKKDCLERFESSAQS